MNELEQMKSNQAMWDEYVRINSQSQMYDLAGFRAGRNALHALEIEELGAVAGKSLLHLQCHFGMDTLTWARLGAQVTGVDFSPEGVRLARGLAAELNLPARFINCNIYDLPEELHETFDIVFTSYGVLTWLPDIPRWARIAASYVKPGGVFYIAEFHPAAYIFSDQGMEWKAEFDYFTSEVLAFPVEGSYADRSAITQTRTSYEWNYPLGKVVSSLIDAGLRIEFLHEFPHSVYQEFPFLIQGADGLHRIPEGMPQVPLIFSIRAAKA
jgi:SAM-dependent methyltransferase